MKECIVCGRKVFSHGYCRMHVGKYYMAKGKVAYTTKQKSRLSVKILKKRLETIYAPYIRMRDADTNGIVSCVCCGLKSFWKGGIMANGHFISRHSSASLVYQEWNTHPQCRSCNFPHNETAKHQYMLYMIKRYGQEKVEYYLSMKNNYIWKPTAFEIEVLIKDYIKKFLEQCTRLKHTPTPKEQKVIDEFK